MSKRAIIDLLGVLVCAEHLSLAKGRSDETNTLTLEDVRTIANEASAMVESLPDEHPTLQIATIHHENGTKCIVALTPAGLDRQLANYCRSWWNDAFPEGSNDPSVSDDVELTDAQIVEAYFTSPQMGWREWVDYGEAILRD